MKPLAFESLEDRCLLTVGPLTLEPFGTVFASPVVATHAGDGSGRLFVAEQGGLVHILRDGQRGDQPFLDIRSLLVGGGASGERGLLGLAFHPEYASPGAAGQGLFYIYYSAPAAFAAGDHDSMIAEFRVSNSDPDIADVSSQRTILRFNQPFSNHNGGDLKFGPDDDLLYISSGDGGSGGDPLGNGQDTGTLLGAILRIDVDGDDFPNDTSRNYSIPAANPFVNDESARDEIFALGLRNPFRMSFDDGPNGTASPDRLFVGDVGQSTFEEVDIVSSGGNYGWNECEGDHVFRSANLPCPSQFVPPIAEYGRSEGVSVIGGFVYRGSKFPLLNGVYLFGDLNGRLMALEEQPDGSFARTAPTIEGSIPSAIIGFGEDEAGELYVLTFSGLLSISTLPSGDVTVQASGEVRVALEGNEIVISDASGEMLRRPADSLTSLRIQLSTGDDRITLANLSGVVDLPVRIDGSEGIDTLVFGGSGHALDLRTLPEGQLTDIEAIDVTGDGSNSLTVALSEVVNLSSSSDTLRITHDGNDTIHYGDGWTAVQPERVDGSVVHRLIQEDAIIEIANTLPFQNPLAPHDANRDGNVTSRDAIQIINALALRRGPLTVPERLDDPHIDFDVSGDNVLSALDALRVINEIARRVTAETEIAFSAASITLLPTQVDSFFQRSVADPEAAVLF